MAHMKDNDRKRIEFLVSSGFTVQEIADDLGRRKSTILRELINRSVESNRNHGCSNRICELFDRCPRVKGYGRDARRSFNCTPRCFGVCPDFIERRCERLLVPSHVCNGCRDFTTCPMMKRVYSAEGAHADHDGILHDSRRGVHPSDGRIGRMNAVLSPCILKGQSVRNVIRSNPEVFEGVRERTVYDYIGGGLFDIVRGDLPEACRRRQGRKPKEAKASAKCRVGRTYREFVVFCSANGITEWAELDTVVGRVGGKVIFTIHLPGGVMLGFLRDHRSPQTCTRVFNRLWGAAGPELFRKLFRVILTDNGTEFSDPGMIEKHRPDPIRNSTLKVPRGVRVFCCDPYCSSQKPHVERYHREIRRILEHGTSFDTLDQDDVNLVLSHVNSHSRGVLDGRTAYGTFTGRFGEEGRAFLDKLGIARIPANEVTLDPILLGAKFKRHADRVVLRKAGVIPAKKTEGQK